MAFLPAALSNAFFLHFHFVLSDLVSSLCLSGWSLSSSLGFSSSWGFYACPQPSSELEGLSPQSPPSGTRVYAGTQDDSHPACWQEGMTYRQGQMGLVPGLGGTSLLLGQMVMIFEELQLT